MDEEVLTWDRYAVQVRSWDVVTSNALTANVSYG